MKYKAGDKFIIEIGEVVGDLYRIAGFRSLTFDDYGLDRLEQVHEHDGCDGCRYEHLEIGDEPCRHCSQHYTDRWTPKADEIQVGDEVEHDGGERGVVVRIGERGIYALKHSADNYFGVGRVAWGKNYCTRTGKTYPELIKALEELPKEE